MRSLRISLFGGIRVSYDSCQEDIIMPRSLRILLAFLVLHRQRVHPRDVLVGLFWGDHTDERARSCLTTALWRLRRILEPDGVPRGTYFTTTCSGEIGFNQESNYFLDVAAFEMCVSRLLSRPPEDLDVSSVTELENTLSLYKGDLLEGLYHDWAIRERERLRIIYLNVLSYIMRYHKHHRAFESSLAFGQRILQYEPLSEETHRDIMRLYSEMGQRTLALKQYWICFDILTGELSVRPAQETQDLYNQIASTVDCQTGESSLVMPSAYDQAFRQLRLGLEDLDKARGQLLGAIHLVESLKQRANPEQ